MTFQWQTSGCRQRQTLGLALVILLSGNRGVAASVGSEPGSWESSLPESTAAVLPDWDERLAEAAALRDAGQFAEAIALYQMLLAEQPDHRPTREGLALTYAYRKDYGASMALYEALVADYPQELNLRRRLAEVYSWQGNYAGAIALYEGILEFAPEDRAVRLALAETLSWAGRYDEAIAAYDQVLSIDPENQQAWLSRPQVAFWANQSDRAIDLYTAALAQYPDQPELLLGLAQVYQSQQQFGQAIGILQPLIDRQHPEALAIRNDIQAITAVSEVEADGIGAQESSFSISQTLRFRLDDGPTRQIVHLGYTNFNQNNFSPIGNTTLQVGVEGQINALQLTGTAGVDWFSRLPAAPTLGLRLSTPLASDLTFTGNLRYGRYKENVATLENQISAFRVEPTLYWQIDPATSLFLFYGAGFYNDGNLEHQASLSLDRQLGDFFVSAFLFYWSFASDPQTGYFSPPRYLLYSGELGWRGNITEQLNCRISATLENQVFSGTSELANTYHTDCGLTLSPALVFDLGYQYSTNAFFSSGRGSASQKIQGRMNLTF